jgi:hypothetical protein
MPIEMRRAYWVWGAMIQRCHTPANKGYRHYGAKGIRVCDRWRHSFDDFIADMGIPTEGQMIERNDSRGHYEPSNCRWTTRTEQNRNRPTFCLFVDVAGDKVPLRDVWAARAHPSVSYRNFRKRLRLRGWQIDEALTRPERGSGELHGYRRASA